MKITTLVIQRISKLRKVPAEISDNLEMPKYMQNRI